MSLLETFKKAALAAFEASNPVNIIYGTVIKSKPLEIEVHKDLVLTEEFLDTAEHLTRHDRIVSINYDYPKTWQEKKDIGDSDKDAESSRQNIGSSPMTPYEKFEMKYAKMTFEDGLKIDDKVVLVRMQGGHKFLVFDRYREGKKKWSYPLKQ